MARVGAPPAKLKPREWGSLIDKVKTPLGFVVLTILILDGLIGAALLKTSASNIPYIIAALLTGVFALCGSVVALAVHPRFGHVFDPDNHSRPIKKIVEYGLSDNDLRAIYYVMSNGEISEYTDYENPSKTWDVRCDRLVKLGLVEKRKQNSRWGYYLTQEGHFLQSLLQQVHSAIG